MGYYIELNNELTITLPKDYNLEDRIKLCDTILNENIDYFDMGSHKTHTNLEIMANYILEVSPKDNEHSVLTEYKKKRNRNKEVLFSEIEQKYDNNKNFM